MQMRQLAPPSLVKWTLFMKQFSTDFIHTHIQMRAAEVTAQGATCL